ncbi:SDR family NAD(P)-dependent oxidoreductase [Agaribacterium sp. ZY112]|uniref:SDR family NAD(P)-dependent oxidoreductase n=1 Tax=Agaribacterium sp. ZY112 TaxID=3233574 RepID=UPI00352358F6
MKSILIVGSSRGIGAELARYFSQSGDKVIGVSRSESSHCEWIKADISTAEGIQDVAKKIANKTIDALIFSCGIWEDEGFTDTFDFRKTSYTETYNIMLANLVAPIELTKAISKNLSAATNPRAIYLGALSGLDHIASIQVAYAASKFGLRGAIQSLRKALKAEGIGFTVINPGNVATEEVLMDIEQGGIKEQVPIPISDIILSTEMILSLSISVELGDINLMQKDN